MTDHNKLAQRIVALGVGRYEAGFYYVTGAFGPDGYGRDAKYFCNDGRVVLALMEKVTRVHTFRADDGYIAYAVIEDGKALERMHEELPAGENESLAIAIVEACLEALETAESGQEET